MIFKIFGVYISVSWLFLCMICFAIFSGKFFTFLLCFFALILHEMGHIIMTYFLGEKINIFYILPFGFCCRLKNQSKIKKDKMIKILLAGPVTSLTIAGFSLFWTREFSLVNFVVGVFNLLPFGMLDGGRLIRKI